jgi:hypothetical protein
MRNPSSSCCEIWFRTLPGSWFDSRGSRNFSGAIDSRVHRREAAGFSDRNWSGYAGIQGRPLGEHDEGVEEWATVFGRGGQVASDRAELFSAGECAQATGDLLPKFDHADVAFGSVVVRRDSPTGGEAQVVVLPVLSASSDDERQAGPRRFAGGAQLYAARPTLLLMRAWPRLQPPAFAN